ncbi:hypothetical protein AURDEDRAFT_186549, partial [Auricularia subglabra TFB-10046 SS5]
MRVGQQLLPDLRTLVPNFRSIRELLVHTDIVNGRQAHHAVLLGRQRGPGGRGCRRRPRRPECQYPVGTRLIHLLLPHLRQISLRGHRPPQQRPDSRAAAASASRDRDTSLRRRPRRPPAIQRPLRDMHQGPLAATPEGLLPLPALLPAARRRAIK